MKIDVWKLDIVCKCSYHDVIAFTIPHTHIPQDVLPSEEGRGGVVSEGGEGEREVSEEVGRAMSPVRTEGGKLGDCLHIVVQGYVTNKLI